MVLELKAEQLSFVELKALARRLLRHDSPLRKVILSQPDTLPKWSGLAKVEVFSGLLYEELGKGR
jgi:hypothetical protein